MADIKMTKPTFSKVETISPGAHCYNVYVKVQKVNKEKKTNNKNEEYTVATGVCGDETALANFKFVGKWADLVEENKVFAIRNGKSDVIDEHIVLQLDNFGKLSEENVSIENVNTKKNISDDKWEKK